MKRIHNIFSKKFFIGGMIVFLITSVILGVVLLRYANRSNGEHTVVRTNIVHSNKSSANIFTNPVLDCEAFAQGDETVIPQKDLRGMVDTLKQKYDIEKISLYFRDLNNGPWIGLNEEESFSPASLLKMPYFIAFLRYGEDSPEVLYKSVTVTAEDVAAGAGQNIVPQHPLKVGDTYTLKVIAERMVTESDNTGLAVIMRSVPQKYLNDIYTTLGNVYSLQGSDATDVTIRVKDVASLFRILYNASYLNRGNSEYALKVFSESVYREGIVSGVPKNVIVAHKFGERIDTIKQGSVEHSVEQIHDCGIVYAHEKPYILCVMTRGNNIYRQTKAIEELSRFFYKKITR